MQWAAALPAQQQEPRRKGRDRNHKHMVTWTPAAQRFHACGLNTTAGNITVTETNLQQSGLSGAGR